MKSTNKLIIEVSIQQIKVFLMDGLRGRLPVFRLFGNGKIWTSGVLKSILYFYAIIKISITIWYDLSMHVPEVHLGRRGHYRNAPWIWKSTPFYKKGIVYWSHKIHLWTLILEPCVHKYSANLSFWSLQIDLWSLFFSKSKMQLGCSHNLVLGKCGKIYICLAS